MAAATKIFWNKEEKQLLIAETRVHLSAGASRLRALHLAQSVLPEARRRTVASLTSMPWLTAAFTPVAPTEAPLTSPLPYSAPTSRKAGASSLSSTLAEALVQGITKLQANSALKEKISKWLMPPKPALSAEAVSPPVPKYSGSPRVLVAGISPAQISRLEAHYAGRLVLSFWQGNETKERLRLLAKECDIAISAVDLIPPGSDATVRSLSPHYIRHTGGLSRLNALLTHLCTPPKA